MKKLHRLLSAFLCIILLSSFVISPIQARAVSTPYFDPATALYGGVVIEGFKEGAKLVSSIIAPLIEGVTDSYFFKRCSDILTPDRLGNINFFTMAFNAFTDISTSTDGTQRFVVDSDVVFEVVSAYEGVYGDIVSDEVLTEDLEIYVPPDSIWSQTELITSDRLLSSGFGDLQTLNENVLAGNKISWQILQKVMSLSGYLRTDFVDDLVSELGTLTSLDESLTKELDDVEAWVNRLNSTVVSLNTTLSGKLDSGFSTSSSILSTLSTEFPRIKAVLADISNYTFSGFYDLNAAVGTMLTTLSGDLATLNTSIGTLQTKLSTDISALQTSLVSQITSLGTSIGTLQTTLSGDLATVNTSLQTLIGSVNTWDRVTIDRVMENMQQIKEYQVNARDTLQTELLKISGYEATINTNMKDYLQGVKDGLFSLQTNTVYRLKTVESAITNLPGKLGSLDDAILEQLQGIGTSLGLISSPTVTTPDSSILDSYGKYEDSLKIPITDGFAIGGNYFNSIRDFLDEDLNGFLVAGLIFEEFAGITFFHKLIITSCSVGLIGTLLGMALNVQSYSIAQRRREEAAQVRAHGRMERSSAA